MTYTTYCEFQLLTKFCCYVISVFEGKITLNNGIHSRVATQKQEYLFPLYKVHFNVFSSQQCWLIIYLFYQFAGCTRRLDTTLTDLYRNTLQKYNTIIMIVGLQEFSNAPFPSRHPVVIKMVKYHPQTYRRIPQHQRTSPVHSSIP